MQVILKPVSQTEPGEIIVNDDLFAIGRHEAPFSTFEPGAVEKLSRRHARIFEQDGIVYIADLGSLNGTTVNATAVGNEPVRLQRNDEICFAGCLCYRIEILGAASPPTEVHDAALKLVMVPEQHKDVLEPVVVTRFPFLINKTSDVFQRYKDSLPEALSFISRRHAHIFIRQDAVLVEDLGSTNGTFVNGERIDEHARELAEGDVLAFGGEGFSYRVGIIRAGEETAAVAAPAEADTSELPTAATQAVDEPTRTTFISSADSFLNIFCAEKETEDDGEPEEADRAAASGGKGREAAASRGALHRYRSIFGEVRNAFADDRKGRAGRYWLIAMVLVVVAGTGLYYLDNASQEIRELIDAGRYEEAAAAASIHLAKHPDDEEVSAMATEAALRAVVPGWLALLEQGEYAQAQQALEQGRELLATGSPDAGLYAALAWVNQLEAFVAQRGGIDAPLRMFEEKETIDELVGWWEQDSRARRRLFGAVSQHSPEFTALRPTIYSHLRSLQNRSSLSVAAAERLREQFTEDLDRGDYDALYQAIDDFQQRYPQVQGVEALREDLDSYRQIDSELRQNNWLNARRLASQTSFSTPLFQERMSRVAEQQLPSAEVMERYRRVRLEWQAGNTDAALAELSQLREERWGEVAERSLQRKQALIEAYAGLESNQGNPGYDRQLLSFYRTLDQEEDVYFVSAVEEDFRRYRDEALEKSERLYAEAQDAWGDYREDGGIRGLHRLQDSVSADYRKLAAKLSKAHAAMSGAMDIHQLLDMDQRPAWQQLQAKIVNEVRLQRQSLNELEMVLEPSLRKAKMDLLPQLDKTPTDAADNHAG